MGYNTGILTVRSSGAKINYFFAKERNEFGLWREPVSARAVPSFSLYCACDLELFSRAIHKRRPPSLASRILHYRNFMTLTRGARPASHARGPLSDCRSSITTRHAQKHERREGIAALPSTCSSSRSTPSVALHGIVRRSAVHVCTLCTYIRISSTDRKGKNRLGVKLCASSVLSFCLARVLCNAVTH